MDNNGEKSGLKMKLEFNQIPIYVIHYKKMEDRKRYLTNFFFESGCSENVNWIEDGQREDLTEELIKKSGYVFDPSISKHLSLGEIGCMIGHKKILSEMLQKQHKFAFVFEDDVVFPDGFVKEFNSVFEKCPDDFDVISLGSCCGIKYPNILPENRFYKIIPNRGRCGYAQLVTYRCCVELAKHTVTYSNAPDWELYNTASNKINPFTTYWVEPPMVQQGSETIYKSSIR